MNREEAFILIKSHVKNEKLVKHMLAVEAIMKAIAKFLGEDEEKWGLIGLLHDIDYEKVDEKEHGMLAADILSGKLDEEGIRAIKAHNFENTDVQPMSRLEKALISADTISGLIIATALVMPSKKLSEVKVRSVKNSFKDKSFARRCSREKILLCEEIGIPREKFFEISLKALQSISSQLGL